MPENEGVNPEQVPDNVREPLSKSPVFLVYRDNASFQRGVPIVREVLEGLGRHVETQVFPVGETEESMQEWMRQNKSLFEGKDMQILRDETVFWAYRESKDGKLNPEDRAQWSDPLRENRTLDKLFFRATASVLTEKGRYGYFGFEEKFDETGERSAGKFMARLVERILLDPKNVPELVWVRHDHMNDHEPFSREQFTPEQAAEIVKQWLIDGGIPKDIIKDITLDENDNKIKDLIKDTKIKRSWSFSDRHSGNGIDRGVSTNDDNRHIALTLPPDEAFADATSHDLITFTPEDWERYRKTIEDTIKARFGPEKEVASEE